MPQACDPARVGYVVGATNPQEMRQIRALELEKGMPLAWVLAPGFGRQNADLSFLKYTGRNVLFPISSGLTHPKYLNGKTPREAAVYWNATFNAALENADMRSMRDLWAEGLLGGKFIKTAAMPDEGSWFTLKNGTKSPVYANMRDLQSDPQLLLLTASLMRFDLERTQTPFDRIAAVPYGALGLAYALASIMGKPVVTPRKEGAKDHGTKDEIVGSFNAGEKILIVEDVATSGGSTIETAEKLRAHGLNVTDACVIVDREQGARQKLAEQGIELHRLATLEPIFAAALRDDNPMKKVVRDYLARTRQG
ncbi:MAG: orotate phosphoribosyltransferase [Alphaproteobacteria bacterium]|nr:orotate phosphoribosyltransferase [Alphaproteobacteria bacterium]